MFTRESVAAYGIPAEEDGCRVSGRQLHQPGLVDTVGEVLEETGLSASCLELELTETVAMQDADTTIRVFPRLKSHGIRLCIDDFGTGYSSLNYLKRFPIDHMKIDKSFVEHSATNREDGTMVRTMVDAMAHALKLKVIAEGVESPAQLKLLAEHNCDEWQGYYCSYPRPALELTTFLKEGICFLA